MPDARERHVVIARLREEIRRLEHRPGRRDGVVSCGLPEVDAALPGGGFPRGAIAELSGGPASGKTAVALALFAALGPEDLVAYVDGRGELYPPAAAARGVDLGRLLVVRPGAGAPRDPASGAAAREAAPDIRAGLWAAEALLASGAFAAVAVDLPVERAIPGVDAVARRLQAAVERGGAVGLWLADGRGLRVPAAVRLVLAWDGGRVRARLAGAAGPARRDGRAA
jgi:protein ImuA